MHFLFTLQLLTTAASFRFNCFFFVIQIFHLNTVNNSSYGTSYRKLSRESQTSKGHNHFRHREPQSQLKGTGRKKNSQIPSSPGPLLHSVEILDRNYNTLFKY